VALKNSEPIYGSFGLEIPESLDEDFHFSSDKLPEIRELMETDRLLFKRRFHVYNSCFRADSLWLYTEREDVRQLGALIMSTVIKAKAKEVTIRLTNPASDIKKLVIRCSSISEIELSGPQFTPAGFLYTPSSIDNHPIWLQAHSRDRLPSICLTNEDEIIVTDSDWYARDKVVIGPGDFGNMILAEFFLNAGIRANTRKEYDIEGWCGKESVSPGSAELKLILIDG